MFQFSILKSLLKDKKTKCVIIEDGEPKYVIIPFEEYQHLQEEKNDSIVGGNSWNEEKVNWEIQDTGEQDLKPQQNEGVSAIKIEDLPF
ncbi:MAG: hypothetical protein WAP23_02535 [Candidatus Spechtbacterales bacterium]